MNITNTTTGMMWYSSTDCSTSVFISTRKDDKIAVSPRKKCSCCSSRGPPTTPIIVPQQQQQQQQEEHQHTPAEASPVKKNNNKKKVISFSPTCSIKSALHVNDYTAEEISLSWYNYEESSEHRQKCVRIVEKIVQGKAGKYCVRGLDRMTPRAVDERNSIRMDTYLAVLREQNKHFLTGRMDEEAIARKYRSASATRHQEEAYRVGRSDAKVALKLTAGSWR
jgi:hypothetical protein